MLRHRLSTAVVHRLGLRRISGVSVDADHLPRLHERLLRDAELHEPRHSAAASPSFMLFPRSKPAASTTTPSSEHAVAPALQVRELDAAHGARGLFALRDIKANEHIFSERPAVLQPTLSMPFTVARALKYAVPRLQVFHSTYCHECLVSLAPPAQAIPHRVAGVRRPANAAPPDADSSELYCEDVLPHASSLWPIQRELAAEQDMDHMLFCDAQCFEAARSTYASSLCDLQDAATSTSTSTSSSTQHRNLRLKPALVRLSALCKYVP